jgi:predicted ATPase/DNA-binding CsgD family transcriptional regulator
MSTAVTRSRLGNLPVEISSFVGRARELNEVRRLISSAHAITVTGPGGIGKSRLALRAARRLERHFPDGVWMVELAELESPDLLAYAVARAIGVYERRGDSIDEALAAGLRDRRLLLVLDNCEHLLDASRRLATSVLSRCERVRILCTSRERLGFPGEAIVALSALELPVDGGPTDALAVAGVDAVRLLVDRATAAAPDFVLTDDNCLAAAEICRRLDGLPLAIELAAVRLASMTADDLRDRLDDRLRLLAAGHRVGPERNQTLRATVDWSYELLAEEERLLWRRLTVFAGSFGLSAAEHVCSGGGLARERVVDLVQSLVAKSILTMAQSGGRGRYRLLETLRLYGAERLAESGEDIEVARRHARWYAELITGGSRPWWGSSRQVEMFQTLDLEWANVETALDFCAGSPSDAELGLQMAANLWLHWVVRGRYRDGSRRLDAFLVAFLALEPTPTPTRAMVMWALGYFSLLGGKFAAARERLEAARDACEEIEAEREWCYAQATLGMLHGSLGEIGQAIDLLSQAHDRIAQLDDPISLAFCCYYLATVFAAAGRLDRARAVAHDGLAASDRAGDRLAYGMLNGFLGTVEWQLGAPEAGESRIRKAVQVQYALGHRHGMVTSLEGLAWLTGSAGQREQAAMLLGAVAALAAELGVIPVYPYWDRHHAACEQELRADMGEARFRDCWERGHAMSREQVVAVALQGAPPTDRHALTAAAAGDTGELSDRELEVARLVASGLSNREIAAELFVSVATVKTHVSHILSKLGLASRVEVARWIAAQQ